MPLTLRPAVRSDYATFANLFPELGVDDPLPDEDAWWTRMAPTTLIAERDSVAAGYLFYEVIGGTLYVRNVVSDPSVRRAGVGRTLLHEALDAGRKAGARRWCLNVKEDNAAAIALYTSLGLRISYATDVLRLEWSRGLQLPRAEVEIRPPRSDEDARIESELKLLRGMLERQRAIQRVLLAAFDRSGNPVGLASFNPSFPGSFPFRARSVAVTGALLHAMHPHREPHLGEGWREDSVQLVFEDDEAQARELIATAGALRVVRILFMEAELPARI